MFTSKAKLQLQSQRLEDMAYAAAYELMINTKLSEANAREMFMEVYPDHGYVIDEVIEDVRTM